MNVVDRFRRGRLGGLVALACGLGGLVALAVATTQSGWGGVLYGFLFWLFAALGCVQLRSVCGLVSGRWCRVVARPLDAACWTVLPLVLAFVPICVGLEELFVWARDAAVRSSPELSHKARYLNEPFFFARAAMYFVVWSALSFGLVATAGTKRHGAWCALTLVVIPTTTIFASLDWGLSLEPGFASTMYALIWIVSQGVAGLAVAILWVRARYGRTERIEADPPVRIVHDLGNLLLTLVILITYVSFLQYLIVWAGDLHAEIPWYLRRLANGWDAVIVLAVALLFVLPFGLLLSRRIKRSLGAVGAIAAMVLAGQAVHLYWLIVPGVSPAVALYWPAVAGFLAVGGGWLVVFTTALLRVEHSKPQADP